jgi:hypothetical protein
MKRDSIEKIIHEGALKKKIAYIVTKSYIPSQIVCCRDHQYKEKPEKKKNI